MTEYFREKNLFYKRYF